MHKAEMYSEASIGMIHAELREALREMYKATPELPIDVAARIAADRVITKFAAGTKLHTEALASYIANSGQEGPFQAAMDFAPAVKEELLPVNGNDLG